MYSVSCVLLIGGVKVDGGGGGGGGGGGVIFPQHPDFRCLKLCGFLVPSALLLPKRLFWLLVITPPPIDIDVLIDAVGVVIIIIFVIFIVVVFFVEDVVVVVFFVDDMIMMGSTSSLQPRSCCFCCRAIVCSSPETDHTPRRQLH